MSKNIGEIKIHLDGLTAETTGALERLIGQDHSTTRTIKYCYTYVEGEAVLDLGDDEWRARNFIEPGDVYCLIGKLVWNGFAVEVKTDSPTSGLVT